MAKRAVSCLGIILTVLENHHSAPTVAIVTKAKAPYWKPLFEAFAEAQPAPWRTLLAWPEDNLTDYPPESVMPRAVNLDVTGISSRPLTVRDGMKGTDGRHPERKEFLPSRALWRLLTSRNVRAIVIHEYSPYTLQALLFAKWHRIPIVVSSDVGRKNRNHFRMTTRLWHAFWGRFASGHVACTPAAMEPLSGGKRPIISTYHAMDSRSFLPLPTAARENSPVVFAFLGRLMHLKGIDLLLQAAARLRDEGRGDFLIRLIGGGDTDWVREWITRLHLETKVELTGFLSGEAIREALGSADVFVLPTRQDTYAAVVHEAACLGLPLLVSKHAGAAETLVEEGRNGFTFEPEKIEDFATAMGKLLDPAVRVPMGVLSRSIAERFSAHERGKALWQWLQSNFRLIA